MHLRYEPSTPMLLAQRYDQLRRAVASGNAPAIDAGFDALAGLVPERVTGEGPVHRAALLRYDAPRRVDLIALRRGARDIAKFEDLPATRALALARQLTREGFTAHTEGPYRRRFDLALSIDGAGDRFSVLASRGDAALRLAEVERDRSDDGTRRAGALLGYPRCCVEAFIATSRSPAAAQDGVNEACLRALADAGPVHWSLHPLSTDSPIGFAPCHGRCEHAMSFARRVFDAVQADAPAAADTLRRTLLTPLLALRVSLFWALVDGAPCAEGTRYQRAVMHDDGALPWLTDPAARRVGAAVAHADTVALTDRTLTLSRAGAETARWTLTPPASPRLLRFET